MITFIQNRCQPWLYKKAECRLCIEVCPVEGCIRFEGTTISISTEDCIGCGICTTACPTSALVMEGLTDRELWNRLKAALPDVSLTQNPTLNLIQGKIRNPDVVFGCTLGSDDSKSKICNLQSAIFINLPCLAILKESHLISIVLSGVKDLYLDITHCDGCSFKHGRRTIDKTISYASSLLEAMGYKDRFQTLDPKLQTPDISHQIPDQSFRKSKQNNIKTITPGPEYSRRELLSFFRQKAVEKAIEGVVGGNRGTAGVKEVEDLPERRSLLLEAFKGIDFSSRPQIKDGRFPIHQLKIGEDCTLCHTCNLFCPTGAIKRVEGEGEVRIDFNLSLCMGCYECIELCPEGAMSRGGLIDLEAVFNGKVDTLFKKVAKACPSCVGIFFPEDGVEGCPICRKKLEQDDRAFDFLFGDSPSP